MSVAYIKTITYSYFAKFNTIHHQSRPSAFDIFSNWILDGLIRISLALSDPGPILSFLTILYLPANILVKKLMDLRYIYTHF